MACGGALAICAIQAAATHAPSVHAALEVVQDAHGSFASNCTLTSSSTGKAVAEGFVLSHLVDGKGDRRCASVFAPRANSTSLPIVFGWHVSGKTAEYCAAQKDSSGTSLGDLAVANGFALVCLEYSGALAMWDFPNHPSDHPEFVAEAVGTDSTPCEPNDSRDIIYWVRQHE